MQRDMELIRRILVEIESRKDVNHRGLKIDGIDDVTLGRHIEMLFKQGFIEGVGSLTNSVPYTQVLITDLSWSGHDFVAALKDQGVWNKIKQSFSAAELAGMPLSVLKDVGVGLLKQWAKKQVGLGAGNDQIDI